MLCLNEERRSVKQRTTAGARATINLPLRNKSSHDHTSLSQPRSAASTARRHAVGPAGRRAPGAAPASHAPRPPRTGGCAPALPRRRVQTASNNWLPPPPTHTPTPAAAASGRPEPSRSSSRSSAPLLGRVGRDLLRVRAAGLGPGLGLERTLTLCLTPGHTLTLILTLTLERALTRTPALIRTCCLARM